MAEYTFYINGEYKTVGAEGLERALKEAGIEEGEEYIIVETDAFEDKCLVSAIMEDTL